MIDRYLLIDNFEQTCARLTRKGVDSSLLAEARDLLLQRNGIQKRLDEHRSQLNRKSREIGQLMQKDREHEAQMLISEVSQFKAEIDILEQQSRETEEKLDHIMLRIPNVPSDQSPSGTSEADNVVLRYEGYDAMRFEGRTWHPHWEIGTELGIYDRERAAKISGSMFALLRGDGARLLHALVQFGLDLNRTTYEEILPPHFVNSYTFTTTGHLPKFEFDAYRLRDDDLWAIPTGEVPLTGMYREEILDESVLPKRMMAYTVCFRREAGSAGKDTRGLQRLHEFHKVELVRICRPEDAQSEFDALLADAERPLKLLGLPYRIVDLCAADLTFSSARIFDIEVYAPGVDRWLEASSVGDFTNFQARRGNIRFRRSTTKKTEFVNILNGSALATPRVWAAILEHGQQPNGTVRIPEVLVPYMGKELIGPCDR